CRGSLRRVGPGRAACHGWLRVPTVPQWARGELRARRPRGPDARVRDGARLRGRRLRSDRHLHGLALDVAIRFVPNDPLSGDVLPPREQPPRPDPGEPAVGFSYTAPVPEALYQIDSVEFRFWQCREAALATLEAWA